VQRAAASQTRINEFLEETPDIISKTAEPFTFQKSIQFKEVGLTYEKSGVKALKDLSFEIEKGQTVGIIGRTGSGKSSLAYLLMRLVDPTSGKIMIDGQELTEITFRCLETTSRLCSARASLIFGHY